jgi:5-methylcytosine-specific restriction endonuclease McrA
MSPDLKAFVIRILRSGSYKWPARNEALKASRVQRGLYKCASCQLVFKKQEVHLDHIDPVIDVKTGFTNFEEYINRLYCDVSGYQVICKTCHSAKTLTENHLRKEYRKINKKVDKVKK